MSAPISIPIGIQDDGSAALGKLATSFDNLYQSANKVSGMFSDGARTSQTFQDSMTGLNQKLETFTNQTTAADRAFGNFTSRLSSGVGTINASTRALADLATQMERVAASGGGGGFVGGGMTSGGMSRASISGASAYSASSIGAMSAAERASLEASYLQSDLNSLLAGTGGGALGRVSGGGRTGSSASGTATGGGGGRSSMARGMVEQMLIYGGAYGAYRGVSSAIGSSLNQSSLLAGETASLGLTYDQGQALNTSSMGYAGSGQSIFNATQLNTAAYVPYTYNSGGSQAGNLAMTKTGAKLAQALGATDPTDAENALALLGIAYGGGAKGAKSSADILTQVTLASGFDLPQLAANVGQFSSQGAARGISKSDLLASYGQMSGVYGPERAGQAAQDMSMLMRMLGGNANAVQRNLGKQLGINLGDPNLVQDSGGWENLLKSINAKTNVQGPAAQQQMLTAIFGPQAGLAMTSMLNHGDFSAFDAARTAGTQGTAMNRAYETTQQFAGTQMKEAEVKFSTAVDKLATAALPDLVKAVQLATDGINAAADIFAGPGGHGGIGASLLGAGVTVAEVFSGKNPFTGDAQRAAARDMGLSGGGALAHGVVPGTPEWDTLPQWAKDASVHPSIPAHEVARYNARGLQYMQTVPTQMLEGLQSTGYNPATPAVSGTAPAGGGGLGGIATGAGNFLQGAGGAIMGAANTLAFHHAQTMIGVRGAATMDLKSAKDKVLNLIAGNGDPAAIADAEATAIQVIMSQPGDPNVNAHNAQVFDDAVQKAIQAKATKQVHDAVTEINAKIADLQAGATLAALEGNTPLAAMYDQQINTLRTANAGALKLSPNQLALDNYNQMSGAGKKSDLGRQRQDLQNAVTMAGLQHNTAAQKAANQALYAFDVANPQGRDASDLALEHAQMLQQFKVATPGPTLIRSPETGLGDTLLGAGSGAGTVDRLSRSGGAHDPQAETIRHLQMMLAKDEKIIQELQRGNENTNAMRDELASGVVVANHPVANRGPVRRHMGI